MKFQDSGREIGSTALGKLILSNACPQLKEEIGSSENWRKSYLGYFAKVAKLELQTDHSAFEIAANGLEQFEKSVFLDDGRNLKDAVTNAWRLNKSDVALVVVTGRGAPKTQSIDTETLIRDHLAEPGVSDLLENLDSSAIDQHLLIALAGGAEYSPARVWLDWGGRVAIVARSRPELWSELISRARASSGTLLVPVLKSKAGNLDLQNISDTDLANVAGLDLVEDVEAIAGWLSMLARTESGDLILGSFAYAPGVKHIEVQAAQHALARAMTESLPKNRVTLTWLATPTDSYAVSTDFLTDIDERYEARSLRVKIRDFIFGVTRHEPELFTSAMGQKYVLIDSTSVLQGPSYALAKRLQRWMAYQQVLAGRNFAYLVSPPAKTHSVLDTRILRATYSGAPHFGLVPFEVDRAVELSAGLLLASLNSPRRQSPRTSYQDLAVHGGLWRLIYSPETVWRAATIRGLFGYFKKP